MRKIIFCLVFVICLLLFSCSTTQPMSESTKIFLQETNLSMVVPLRVYYWVRIENSNRIQNDIFSGKLDFLYDSSGEYLLRTISEDGKIISVWGNQILLQEDYNRSFIFTSFIASAYALESNKDPLDIAFDVLNQILLDRGSAYEETLIDVFRLGIQQYRIGSTVWERYKEEYFIVENKTIKIR